MPLPAEKLARLILLGIVSGLTGCASLGLHHQPTPIDLSPVAATQDGGHCVDAQFAACAQAWQALALCSDSGRPEPQQEYNQAVWKLLESASRHGRIHPVSGLRICSGGQWTRVPIRYRGFAWQPHDFQRLHCPPQGHEPLLTRRYHCPGIGCPVVVERARRDCDPIEARFFPERTFFAATPVLEFHQGIASGEPGPAPLFAELTFYNPLQAGVSAVNGQPLATDLSAAVAVTLDQAPRSYFAGFREPGGTASRARLAMLEPYQAGKVPLVLVHGLFSDPQSWADLLNDLRASPGFTDRFQVWVFRYPTGRGFLQSATALRAELQAAVRALDPDHSDPALQRMVLIGHSMGGLIAKLQVTHSDELVWNALANQPLEAIVTDEVTRGFLAENCYFDPSSHVERVIFIASPHAGSTYSSGLIGKTASLLVEPAPEQEAMHEQLLRDNPGVFNPRVERRLPTSIDMLAPDSPLLAVMKKMRLKPNVTLHNIIGVSQPLSLDGPTDGVVSVQSAKHPHCASTLAFHSPHAKVHRDLRTTAEVIRILNLHLQCLR